MNISQVLDQAADRLDNVDWKTVAKELIELWTIIFKGIIVLTVGIYIAGETLGTWVHRTNDWLAANWVRMLALTPVMEEEENEEDEVPLPTVPSTPPEARQEIRLIADEVSVPTPPTIVEVEPMLPLVQAEVVEILVLDEQPPPVRRSRSRNSASNSLEETVNKEAEPATPRRPRGRRAHKNRNKHIAA